MSKLKELTWEIHQRAERSVHARKLLNGMEPREYHRYLYNQYTQYAVLENIAMQRGVLDGIEGICRAKNILQDLDELELMHSIQRNNDLLCPVVDRYASHIVGLDREGLLAHIYVRHFGDMYGGQMIKKRNPGSGRMYEFDNVENLKTKVREMLHDGMAEEATKCFEFAIQLFEELEQ